MVEQAELLKVVGSLIDDNDSLKRDNAELQSLLAEAREDIQHMQEELEEQRANPTSLGGGASISVCLSASRLTAPCSIGFPWATGSFWQRPGVIHDGKVGRCMALFV